MWLPDGLPWSSALDAQCWVMLPAIGNTSAQPASRPSGSLSSPKASRPPKSPTSDDSARQRTPESGERQLRGKALNVRRLSLIALSLMTLGACSLLRPKLPEAAPVPACPIIQCLDRALKVCEGVQPRPVHTCADAVLIASDALGEVVVCQESHAALIRCVEQFNHDHGR